MGKVDKVEEEEKIKGYGSKGRLQCMDSERIPPVSPTFGKFPWGFWKEWNEDCEDNYNGTRWQKAYTDHIIAKQSKKEAAMWEFFIDEFRNRLSAIEQKQAVIEEEPEPEPEEEKEDWRAPNKKKSKKKVKKDE